MKSRFTRHAAIGTLFALVAIPLCGSAHARASFGAGPGAYKLIILGSLGGTYSFGADLNDRGWIAGPSYLPGGLVEHATLWTLKPNRMIDLGTLGGPNSTAGLRDDRGLVIGYSDTSAVDPLNENFCLFGSGDICEGFVWKGHGLVPLPPLSGGNNSEANDVNDLGQVTGDAENGTHDPGCIAPTVLDYEAVIWGPKEHQIKKLPPLKGDAAAQGVAINDNGDVIGESGPCGAGQDSLAAYRHAVLWHHGKPIALPTLGGTMANIGFSINDSGQAVGFGDLPGNRAIHAIFWKTPRQMVDLGTLPGDTTSYTEGINNEGQILGSSCGAITCRIFIWQNGVMTDLSTLVPPNPRYSFTFGGGIADSGAVSGQAFDQKTGDTVAFVALPTGQPAVRARENVERAVALPRSTIQNLLLHLRKRF